MAILKLEVIDVDKHPVQSNVRIELSFKQAVKRTLFREEFSHIEIAASEVSEAPKEEKAKDKKKATDELSRLAASSGLATSEIQTFDQLSSKLLPVERLTSSQSTVAAQLSETGVWTADLPGANTIEGDVHLRITAPDGQQLVSRLIPHSELSKASILVGQVPVWKPKNGSQLTNPRPPRLVKVNGRLISRAGNEYIGKRQIVIYTLDTANQDPEPIAVLRTSKAGYFSFSAKAGKYHQVLAEISGVRSQVFVRVETSSVTVNVPLKAGFLQEKMLLIVDSLTDDGHDDGDCQCGCSDEDFETSTEALLANPSYREDLGGGKCADFTKPNRSFEEFSYYQVVRTTEPQIVPSGETGISEGLNIKDLLAEQASLNATLGRGMGGIRKAQILIRLANIRTLLKASSVSNVPVSRGLLSHSNRLDWDESPTFFQACSVAHGHILHIKQKMSHFGYSIGDIVGSIPLAPGQKKQIVEYSWERQDTVARSESASFSESMTASTSGSRDIKDIMSANVNEKVSGKSKSSNFSLGGTFGNSSHGGGSMTQGTTLGATVPVEGILLSVGQAIGKSLMGGVANVVGLGGGFSTSSSNAFQNATRNIAGQSMQQIKYQTMESASAVRNMRTASIQTASQRESFGITTQTIANYNHCHALTIQFFQCLRHYKVSIELADVQECLFVPYPISAFISEKALRWKGHLAPSMDNESLAGFEALERIHTGYAGVQVPNGSYADDHVAYLNGSFDLLFGVPRPGDTNDNKFDSASWGAFSSLLGHHSAFDLFALHLGPIGVALRADAFVKRVWPVFLQNYVKALELWIVPNSGVPQQIPGVDFTLIESYIPGKNVKIGFSAIAIESLGISRRDIDYISIRLPHPTFTVPSGTQATVTSISADYETRYFSGSLVRVGRVANDLLPDDPATIRTPLNARDQVNPIQEDVKLATKLLDKLNSNLHFYHAAIFSQIDELYLFSLLDGFRVDCFRPDGTVSKISLASAVEAKVMGFAGNSMILPVSRGLHLDPTFKQDADDPIDLLDFYQPTTPIEPTIISVPTPGIFAEAIMGSCNSCEKKDESRFWRWQESPIDDPTQILPISTDSRYQEPADAKVSDFPTSIVNFHGAPTLPNPASLSDALAAVTKSDVFRDVTGLNQNQLNSIEALKQAIAAAQFGASASKELLTTQMQALQDLTKAGLASAEKAQELGIQAFEKSLDAETETQKKLNDIERAKQSGLIDDDQAKKLAMEVFSPASGEKVTKDLADRLPAITDEIVKSGGSVTAKDSSGEIKVSKPTAPAPTSTPTPPPSANWIPPVGITKIDLWIKAFIPEQGTFTHVRFGQSSPHAGKTAIPHPTLPDYYYLTDQRSFSKDVNASARMNLHVELNVGQAVPNMHTVRAGCDITIETKGSGEERARATADGSGIFANNFSQSSNQSIRFWVEAAASDPLISVAPDIDFKGWITLDFKENQLFFDLLVDEFPAFEGYFSIDGGPAKTIFQLLPEPGASPFNLFGDANVSVNRSMPIE